MLRLRCVAQNYDWGKKGSTSAVAQLLQAGATASAGTDASAAATGSSAIDEKKPYAEYWFGTHPSGPSRVVIEAEGEKKEMLLQEWLLVSGKAREATHVAFPCLLSLFIHPSFA